jgi:hypothetical protein
MLAVEAINGYGQLIMDSQLDSSLFFPTNGMNGQFCRLDFTYDEKGQVVHEVRSTSRVAPSLCAQLCPAQAEAFKKVGNVRNTRGLGGRGRRHGHLELRYSVRSGWIRQ